MPCMSSDSTPVFAGKDFGGGREASDYDAAATAGREFAEETLGLFAGCSVDQNCVLLSAATMSEQIRQHIRTLEVVHELRQVRLCTCSTPCRSILALSDDHTCCAAAGQVSHVCVPDSLHRPSHVPTGHSAEPAECGHRQRREDQVLLVRCRICLHINAHRLCYHQHAFTIVLGAGSGCRTCSEQWQQSPSNTTCASHTGSSRSSARVAGTCSSIPASRAACALPR